MTRSPNRARASLALAALEAFVREAYGGRSVCELHPHDRRDAIADLIADLGHYADHHLRKRTPFTELVSHGVGMWSAERDHPRGDPEANHSVHVAIDDGGEP